uniref:Uncharacterized protein n=1 Tax=Alexandrium monilatum TaxID=311494 RepID=A0A7S4UTA1_9DINO
MEWPPRPQAGRRAIERPPRLPAQQDAETTEFAVLDQEALDFLLEPVSSSLDSPSPTRWPESPLDSLTSDFSQDESREPTRSHRSVREPPPDQRRSILDTFTDGLAGLWPDRVQSKEAEPGRAPESESHVQPRGEGSHAPAAEEPAEGGDSHESRSSAAAAASKATAVLGEAAEDLTRGFKRLSVNLASAVSSATLWQEAQQAEHGDEVEAAAAPQGVDVEGLLAEARGAFQQLLGEAQQAEHGDEMEAAAAPRGVDVEGLLAEARGAFQQLLGEVPEVRASTSAGDAFPQLLPHKASRGPESGSKVEAVAPPLMSSVMRTRLIGHMVNCCEAVSGELSREQVRLWHAFVARDLSLRCMLPIDGPDISAILVEAGLTPELAENCFAALCEREDESEEVDFVDILDLFTQERHSHKDSTWSFSFSLRRSIMGLLGETSTQPSAHVEPSPHAWLRERCVLTSLASLAAAAAAYQRCFVLVASWRCEQRVVGFLSAAAAGGSIAGAASGAAGWPPQPLPALLEVLRGTNAAISPTERVLWEFLSAKGRQFDGTFHKDEVAAVMLDLQSQGQEQSSDEELQQLIATYQAQSVDRLFAGNRRSVTLADIFRWWWDMTAEFRKAAGLVVPAVMLSRAIDRRVEEMFRAQLRRSAEPKAARSALHGCSRAFAEVCALRADKRVQTSFADLAAGGLDDYKDVDSSDAEYMDCVQLT